MGESRNNPNSPRYRGPLPDFLINVGISHVFVPPEDWIAANKEALAGPNHPAPPLEICNVRFVLMGVMAYPSSLVPQPRWPAATTQVAVLGEMPFVEFKRRIDEQLSPPAEATKH